MNDNKCSNLLRAKYRALAFAVCLKIIFVTIDVGVGKYRHVRKR